MSSKHAHLEMIQGVVNRLSHNSFLLKGWTVVLVSAMFALAANDAKLLFVLLSFFPAIIFWLLDGYFLRQERLFRALYDYVRLLNEDEIDFSMNTTLVKENVAPFVSVVFSRTLTGFHGAIVTIITVVIIYSF